MKAIKIFILAGCLATAALVSWIISANSLKKADKNSVTAKGFAVVELFTSEGCSSCPPADELVEKIQSESNDLPVYILSFHVDYWNRLGWKDVFSNAEYSKRQNQYADWLNLQSVYTPQIVVNGKKEFIGSEEGTLRNAIKSGLQKASSATLTLSHLKSDKNQVSLQYHAEEVGGKTSLLLALVQKAATVNIKSGENGGRTLSHIQVVREIKVVVLNGKDAGNVNMDIPSNLNQRKLEIIAFLQNTNNGEITAATKLPLDPVTTIAKAAAR